MGIRLLSLAANCRRSRRWRLKGFFVLLWLLSFGLPCTATSVEITASTGTPYMRMACSSRCVVRTASGDVYAIIYDISSTPTIRVFESTDGGASWTQQDTADAPSGAAYENPSAAIDGNGNIDIAYWDATSSSTGLRYVTFSTTTNTFSGDTAVTSVTSAQPETYATATAIAIDSNNYAHVIYNDIVNGSLVVTYVDNVGGSWNTPVQVHSEAESVYVGAGDILIDENNLPEICFNDPGTSFDFYAAIGNANKATSFTTQNLGPANWLNGGSITMDSSGNTWILYEPYSTNGSGTLALVEHKAADPWSTWQQPVSDPDLSNLPSYESVAAMGTTIYVLWNNAGSAWQAYNGSSWSTVSKLDQSGSPVVLGWSEYFDSAGSSQIDVLLLGNAPAYWDEISPTIWTVSPNCGSTGFVKIMGSNFGSTEGTNTVTFSGLTAPVTSWNNTEIDADIPSGVTSGPIVVTVGMSASNPAAFSAPSTAQPRILGITPDLGGVGAAVAINGENLCTASVTFNGVPASPTSWNTDQQIVTPVPAGATSGPVIATVNSLNSNPFMFTVLDALAGTVTSASNGNAIAGATVQAVQSNNILGSATTASDGTYAIPNLVPGSYAVRFYANGFGTSVVDADIADSGTVTTVNGSLGSPGTISGKVTEADGVTPVVGATVTAAQGGESVASSTTDGSGNYNMATLSAGTYTVVAGVAGFGTSVSSNVMVTAGNTTTANFVLTIQSTPTVTYSYDNLRRLTGMASQGTSATYTYDAAGNLLSIQVITPPTISGFSPTSGKVGTSVTITGTGFSSIASQDTVTFNGTAASISSASSTQIVTAVPRSATSGPITVTSPGGSATSSSSFTVTKH